MSFKEKNTNKNSKKRDRVKVSLVHNIGYFVELTFFEGKLG